MIEAVIFDLDGTLVQTEKLKALSYAKAAVELCPYSLDEETVIEAFKDVVGLSRREVATTLVDRFDLSGLAISRMAEFGVATPWQAYVQLRLRIYEEMISDPNIIINNQWAHNVALLQQARTMKCKVGLATMSYAPQVGRVLGILELTEAFEFIATRDDVTNGKPDPEIYHLVAAELGVSPANTLVIEDSPSGVQAALAAGMQVIAVSTPFTKQRLMEANLLPENRIAHDPEQVMGIAQQIFEANS